jgi:hypothetical protein
VLEIDAFLLPRRARGWKSSVLRRSLTNKQVTLPFPDLPANFTTFSPWTISFYLNGACIAPSALVSEEIGPQCLSGSVGHSYNFTELVTLAVDNALSGYSDRYYPKATADHVRMSAFHATIVPFVFYVLGMIEMVVMLVSILMVFCAGNFALLFHLAVLVGSLLSVLIATAILTAMATSREKQLRANGSEPYIADARPSPGFLGAGWGAACAVLVAGVLLVVDWRYEVRLSGRRWREIVRVRRRQRAGPPWSASREGDTALDPRELRARTHRNTPVAE